MWCVFWVRLGSPPIYACGRGVVYSVRVRPVVCVGACCVRCFLRTAGGLVAWPVLGRAGACCVCVGAWWAIFCGVSGFCCVVRILCAVWGWWRGVFRVSASDFPVCMTWIFPPCLILTASSPFPGASGNLCAETFIFRVQCLCGRADVWGARKVVFGYGAPGKKASAPWAHCLIPPFPGACQNLARKPLI